MLPYMYAVRYNYMWQDKKIDQLCMYYYKASKIEQVNNRYIDIACTTVVKNHNMTFMLVKQFSSWYIVELDVFSW